MTKKLTLTIASSVLTIGLLGACGMNNDNDRNRNNMINPEDVRYNGPDIRDDLRINDGYNNINRTNNGVTDRHNTLNPLPMDEYEPDLDEEPSEQIRQNMRWNNIENNAGLNNNRVTGNTGTKTTGTGTTTTR